MGTARSTHRWRSHTVICAWHTMWRRFTWWSASAFCFDVAAFRAACGTWKVLVLCLACYDSARVQCQKLPTQPSYVKHHATCIRTDSSTEILVRLTLRIARQPAVPRKEAFVVRHRIQCILMQLSCQLIVVQQVVATGVARHCRSHRTQLTRCPALRAHPDGGPRVRSRNLSFVHFAVRKSAKQRQALHLRKPG